MIGKEIKNNVGQPNSSPLALPCSRIPLVHGEVYCLPCDGWAFVCKAADHRRKNTLIIRNYFGCDVTFTLHCAKNNTMSCLKKKKEMLEEIMSFNKIFCCRGIEVKKL